MAKTIKKRDETAAVKRFCEALGDDYRLQSIDYVPCAYRRIDKHHDIEVDGYVRHVNDGGNYVNIYLWFMSDPTNPHKADRLAAVRYVPNDPKTVRAVCDLLVSRIARP